MTVWTFLMVALSLFLSAVIIFWYGLIVCLVVESESKDSGMVAIAALFIIPIWIYLSYAISGALL